MLAIAKFTVSATYKRMNMELWWMKIWEGKIDVFRGIPHYHFARHKSRTDCPCTKPGLSRCETGDWLRHCVDSFFSFTAHANEWSAPRLGWFTLWPGALGFFSDRRLDWHHVVSVYVLKRENYLPLPAIDVRFSGHQSHRTFSQRNELGRPDATDK